MADPILLVSIDGGTPASSLQVSELKRLDIIYTITPNGNKMIRIEFPVFAITDDNASKALLYTVDWVPEMAILIPSSAGTLSHPDNKVGVIDIQINDPAQDVKLKLAIPSGQVLSPLTKKSLISQALLCGIRVPVKHEWIIKSTAKITIIDDAKPSIIRFTAKKIFVATNENITLDWQVLNAKTVTITAVGEDDPVQESTDQSGSCTYPDITATTKFQISANRGMSTEISAIITVTVFVNSTKGLIKNLFNNQKIMGLYAYQNMMYALILETTDIKKNPITPAVLFWESADGGKWTRTTVSNAIIPFTYVSDGNPIPIDIPQAVAGSPGVVFNDKLYLIGGSRYDTDFKSNEVYCYDFTSDWGWQKINTQALDTKGNFLVGPAPRMGHSCVVFNKGSQIWMIGGITDEGATNEVWTFDGKTWVLQNPMSERRGMASAITWKDKANNEQIQLFGGFGDMPDLPDKTIQNSLFFSASGWAKIVFNNTVDSNVYYNCAAAVLPINDGAAIERFIFGNYKDSQGNFKNNIVKIDPSNGELDVITSDGGYGLNNLFSNIQTLTFKEVIWLCGLQASESKPDNEFLHYFVYLEDNT